jgi:hypothetical protein
MPAPADPDDRSPQSPNVNRCSRRTAAYCAASAAPSMSSRHCCPDFCREITLPPRAELRKDRRDHQRRHRKRDPRIECALLIRRERSEVERHASSGPTPVRNSRKQSDRQVHAVIKRRAHRDLRALHILRQHREQRPPQHTKQAVSSIRLLNRKLDSRSPATPAWFSVFRWSRCSKR